MTFAWLERLFGGKKRTSTVKVKPHCPRCSFASKHHPQHLPDICPVPGCPCEKKGPGFL